jgi:hypothetical protein
MPAACVSVMPSSDTATSIGRSPIVAAAQRAGRSRDRHATTTRVAPSSTIGRAIWPQSVRLQYPVQSSTSANSKPEAQSCFRRFRRFQRSTLKSTWLGTRPAELDWPAAAVGKGFSRKLHFSIDTRGATIEGHLPGGAMREMGDDGVR